MQNYGECINDANRAIEIEPNFVKSYYRKAKALILTDQLAEALETVNKGAELEPDNSDF